MLNTITGRSFTGLLLLNLVLNMIYSSGASLVAATDQLADPDSANLVPNNSNNYYQDQEVAVTDSSLPAMMGVTKRHHHHSKEMLRVLESRFLQKLGLKSRPKPKNNMHIPEHMIELYHQHVHSDLHHHGDDEPMVDIQLFKTHKSSISLTGDANTVRSHNQHDSGDDHDGHDNEDDDRVNLMYSPIRVHLRFNVSVPQTEQLKGAELRLFRQSITRQVKQSSISRSSISRSSSKSAKSSQHQPNDSMLQRIFIEDILRTGEDPILRPIDTHVVDVRHTDWISFDVSPAVHRWIDNPSQNHGLYVTITSVNGSKSHHEHVRLKRSVRKSAKNNNNNNNNDNDENWHQQQPLLLTYSNDESELIDSDVRYDQKKKRRQRNAKRSAKRRHRGKGRKDNCRRHHLYVDFSDVGWNDWIVAPPGYQAYYCSGECPFPLSDHLNSTNHAIVQTLVNSVNPTLVPKACCIPTELSPISMLYVDEYDKVVLKNYQDMVVEGCGCR